jgi:aquaporin Z
MTEDYRKYLAELVGTAVLVFIGCSAIVLGGFGASMPLGIIGIGITFGMAVTAMAYTIGPISGCHINPAVTAAVWAAGRMNSRDAIGYIVAQLIGGIIGALILYLIVRGRVQGYNIGTQGLGQNGWQAYTVWAAILAEFFATLIFTLVILAVTGPRGATPIAGLVIGLTLMIIHFAFIPVSGASVNGARSLGPAIFVGGTALAQVWLYLVVPTLAGALAGWLVRSKTFDV